MGRGALGGDEGELRQRNGGALRESYLLRRRRGVVGERTVAEHGWVRGGVDKVVEQREPAVERAPSLAERAAHLSRRARGRSWARRREMRRRVRTQCI